LKQIDEHGNIFERNSSHFSNRLAGNQVVWAPRSSFQGCTLGIPDSILGGTMLGQCACLYA